MKPDEFIKDRYDWSSEDLERWSEALSKLPMADYGNVIDLMVSFAKHHLKLQEEAIVKIFESRGASTFERNIIMNAYKLNDLT